MSQIRTGQRPDGLIRVCSAQMASIWEDPDKSLAKAGVFIRHAAASGADIICFPEQFATGWNPEVRSCCEDMDGRIISALRDYGRDAGIAVIGSIRQNFLLNPRNTAVVIANDGALLTSYAKIHLFSPAGEDSTFSPGTELGIFDLGSFRCGIAICYDLRFPELFSAYAARGTHAVFLPAAWPASRVRLWELFIAARAAENQMYIVGVNTTGTNPVDTYSGASMTADPHGTIISRAGDAEQLLFCDLDPAMVDDARSAIPVGKDRKNTLYRNFMH